MGLAKILREEDDKLEALLLSLETVAKALPQSVKQAHILHLTNKALQHIGRR